MNRGEVWRVRIPPGPGHAQTGERPAVIVLEDSYTALLPTVLIVPFTSNLAATRFPGTLLVHPDGPNGLSAPSVALVFQMRALDKRGLLRQLGTLDPQTPDQVLDVLDRATGR